VRDVEVPVDSFVDSVPHGRDKSHVGVEFLPAHSLEDIENGKRGSLHALFGDVVEINGAKHPFSEPGYRFGNVFENVEVIIWRIDKSGRVNQGEGHFSAIDGSLYCIDLADIGALNNNVLMLVVSKTWSGHLILPTYLADTRYLTT